MLRRLAMLATIMAIAATPALAQTAPSKHKSPGEIAAADRIAMEKRANCLKEARAKKLGFFARRRYVNGCVKR